MKKILLIAAMQAAALAMPQSPATQFVAGAFARDLMAQTDSELRGGQHRTPGIVVEQPRPPLAAIETEGRGEHRSCRSATAHDARDGANVTRSEQLCER